MRDSSPALIQLRESLQKLEPRRSTAPSVLFPLGDDRIDAALGGGLARGRLHELFADEEDASSGAGVAALLSLLAGKGRPILWLRAEALQKRAGLVQATGLMELGIDPASLLLVLAPDEATLLHAAAEAARCTGLGALLIEGWGNLRGLDLTASRRLMLAAETSGVTVFLLRVAADPALGAADTRWRVRTAPSVALEADAPGASLFQIELLRRRAGPPAGPWHVEWDRDRLCFQHPADGRFGAGSAYDDSGYDDSACNDSDYDQSGYDDSGAGPPQPPLSRPVLPLAAGGTAAAGSTPSVRRAG